MNEMDSIDPTLAQERIDKAAYLQQLRNEGADASDIFMAEQDLMATQARAVEISPDMHQSHDSAQQPPEGAINEPDEVAEAQVPTVLPAKAMSSSTVPTERSTDDNYLVAPPPNTDRHAPDSTVDMGEMAPTYQSGFAAAVELSKTTRLTELLDTHGLPLGGPAIDSEVPDYSSLISLALSGELEIEEIPKPEDAKQRRAAKLAIQHAADITVAQNKDQTDRFHKIQVALLKVGS